MNSSSLQNLLTRLYIRASHGQPLCLSEAEVALYAGKNHQLRTLLAGMNNGDSLAELLRRAGGVPDTFIRIISTGEQSGRLAEALKATLDGLPLAGRLRFQGWMLQFYLLLNLGAVLLFLLFYASSFRHLYSTLFGADLSFAGIYSPFLLLGHPVVTLCGVAVVALPLLFSSRTQNLLFRLLPPLARNQRRLVSLELETRYLMLRSSGYPPDRCLEGLATDLGANSPVSGLSSAVSAIRNGESVSAALEPVIAQSGLEAFCSIAVAEATPDPAISLVEQIALVSAYLKEHLAHELTLLFNWLIVACGVVVALAVVYVFKAIISSYAFLEYLP